MNIHEVIGNQTDCQFNFPQIEYSKKIPSQNTRSNPISSKFLETN